MSGRKVGGACAAALLLWPAVAGAAEDTDEPFPPRSSVAVAKRYADARRGLVSFAVIDSRGGLRGTRVRRTYVSASVVKAMLLVAYLRKTGDRLLSPTDRRLLAAMIVRSDNPAATTIYRRVGDAALRRLARRAGMRRFSVRRSWANARLSAADLTRFFLRIDGLCPEAKRAYARALLSSIVRGQRWGFTPAARRAGFRLYFKGGWRRTPRGRLVHEAALLERGGRRIALAVLSDGNPSHSYGAATVRGVAARVLRRQGRSALRRQGRSALRRAGLVDVRRFAPGVRLDLRYAGPRNLTGRRLPGYCRAWAFLRRPAAVDLAGVERSLNRRRLGLIVYDAYRPARASLALVRWAVRAGRPELVGTYIARRSRHNKGSAVDVGLARLRDGRPLDMGTPYDSLSPRSRTGAVGGAPGRRRRLLVRAMERRGWRNYRREWWHFDHRAEGRRYLDVPLGC
jgi:D-alanyl-D-alanine dipeptidase